MLEFLIAPRTSLYCLPTLLIKLVFEPTLHSKTDEEQQQKNSAQYNTYSRKIWWPHWRYKIELIQIIRDRFLLLAIFGNVLGNTRYARSARTTRRIFALAMTLRLGVDIFICFVYPRLFGLNESLVTILELYRMLDSGSAGQICVHVSVHMCPQLSERCFDVAVFFIDRCNFVAQFNCSQVILPQSPHPYYGKKYN